MLENETTEEVSTALTAAYLADNNFVKASEKLDSLSTDSTHADFCKLYNCVVAYKQTAEQEKTLLTSAKLRTPIEQVALATTNKLEVGMAKNPYRISLKVILLLKV